MITFTLHTKIRHGVEVQSFYISFCQYYFTLLQSYNDFSSSRETQLTTVHFTSTEQNRLTPPQFPIQWRA
jgi:hypothetical protein